MKPRLLAPALLIGFSVSASLLPPASLAYPYDPTNSLYRGAASVQFLTFGGGYRPAFRTSGLYLKWHVSDRSALRFGTDFSLDESSGKNPLPDLSDLFGYGASVTSNERTYGITLSSEYERYVDATGAVTIFVGFGPYWSRGRAYYDQTSRYETYPSGYVTQTYQNEQRSWEVGGSAAMGFEWFFKRKLSLLGRVGGNVGVGKRHINRRDGYFDGAQIHLRVERFDAKTVSAGIAGAALGASVYF